MDTITNPSEQAQMSMAPEVEEGAFINILTKPFDQLPPVGDASIEGEEFWGRRKLRPDTDGGSFHNLPILKFGVSYESDEAVLTVPSKEYLNNVVQVHNPGGFTFVGAEGLEKADAFLANIAAKRFPQSNDRAISVTGIPDTYREFRREVKGEPYTFDTTELKVSLYEHDLVDHTGLAAVPEQEADKIAAGAQLISELEHDFNRSNLTSILDRYLDVLSEYATVAGGGSQESAEYKDWLWGRIEEDSYDLGHGLMSAEIYGLIYPRPFSSLDDAQKQAYFAQVDELMSTTKAKTFILDRAALDMKIQEMQALRPDPGGPTEKVLGSLAVAA